jgi:hypothetical protein
MSESFRVFVNERPVSVSPGADVLAAIDALDAELGRRVRAREAYVTDGRGVKIGGDVLLSPGAILRVVVPARRGDAPGQGADLDA